MKNKKKGNGKNESLKMRETFEDRTRAPGY